MKKSVLFFMTAAIVCAATFITCKEDNPEEKVVAITGVSLNKASLDLEVGQSETLLATVTPAEATNKRVTWSSSAEGVALVDAAGKVTAIGAGSSIITVTTADGSKTATCNITVTPAIIAVTGVELDMTTLTLGVGSSEWLRVTVVPDDATNKSVVWSSNAEEVATVSEYSNYGVVRGVSAGTATITVTTVDGSKTATCLVTIDTGDGSSDNPFRVSTVADLYKVGTGRDGWTLDSYYYQTSDITLSDYWTPIGTEETPFTGYYDGYSHAIINVNVAPGFNHSGLFGYIGTYGYVGNCAVIIGENNITGLNHAGGIAGETLGKIRRCFVAGSGSVIATGTNSNAGGVAGTLSHVGSYLSAEVEDCYSTVNVISEGNAGGIAGINGGTIQFCYSTGNVKATSSAGGIASINYSSSFLYSPIIENCVALNKVVETTNGSSNNIGRVCSWGLYGIMANNYARESDMLLMIDNFEYTPDPSDTGNNGENVSQENYDGANSAAWWRETMKFSYNNWIITPNSLPHIWGFDGITQNPTVTP